MDGRTTVDTLPDTVVAAISKDMAEADPQAEIELALACPACGHAWFALFDIAAFLWSEIHAWAQRTLHDVHILARAYGWREPKSARHATRSVGSSVIHRATDASER